MNKKAIFYGLLYAALVIGLKLYILLGGYSLSKFGYYYSNITAILLILPFYYLVLKSVRDKDYNGIIGGRESMRISLSLFAVSVILISIYNYFEFKYHGAALAENYYRSQEFINYLHTQKNLKEIDYPKIIDNQIVQAKTSAFKATTGKLFSYLIIGLSGAFIVSTFMKRQAPKTT